MHTVMFSVHRRVVVLYTPTSIWIAPNSREIATCAQEIVEKTGYEMLRSDGKSTDNVTTIDRPLSST